MCVCLNMVSFGNSLYGKDNYPNLEIKKPQKIKQVSYNSQISQDEFVDLLLYNILDKKDHGFYLEIGAGEPVNINNTYYLEKKHGWTGVSIDITVGLDKLWYSFRKNPLLIEDATKANYVSILETFPQVIDYLTLDIDGYYDLVLQKIPLNDYIFKIITIEHDFYKYGDTFRERERKILSGLGYYLLCPDVSRIGFSYEDWWIHPSAFPASVFTKLSALDLKRKDHKKIIQIIRDAMSKKE